MKQLIFIDNDNSKCAEKDSVYIQSMLDCQGVLPEEYIQSMKLIPDFYKMTKDEACDLLFSGKCIVCTWSMYTATHFNSLGMLRSFLRTAASSKVHGIVYVDGSGEIVKGFQNLFNQEKGILEMLYSIENNYIITIKDAEFKRLVVDFSKGENYWNCIHLQDIPIDSLKSMFE